MIVEVREREGKKDKVKIEIDGKKYTITERFGRLNIHSHQDNISVHPCVANEVDIDSILK
jgi:hypothetical protein